MKNYLELTNTVLSTLLFLVTTVYVVFTKKILQETINAKKLTSNPTLGLKLESISISKEFGPGRRQLGIQLNILNLSDFSALEVFYDAEITLQYKNISGKKTLPGRFEIGNIPFLKAGEEKKVHIAFGHTLVKYILEDFRETSSLNFNRIEEDPSRDSFNGPSLKIYIYYKNNLNQYFETTYETYLSLEGNKIPLKNETAVIKQVFIPREKFHSGIIKEKKMLKKIKLMDKGRDLCGW